MPTYISHGFVILSASEESLEIFIESLNQVQDDMVSHANAQYVVVPQALQDDRFPANTTILIRLTMTNVTS